MERFQNTTRHTEMLPMIPTNVVIPSNIPMVRTIPDSGMLFGESELGPSSRIDDLRILSLLEMSFCIILTSKDDVSSKNTV